MPIEGGGTPGTGVITNIVNHLISGDGPPDVGFLRSVAQHIADTGHLGSGSLLRQGVAYGSPQARDASIYYLKLAEQYLTPELMRAAIAGINRVFNANVRYVDSSGQVIPDAPITDIDAQLNAIKETIGRIEFVIGSAIADQTGNIEGAINGTSNNIIDVISGNIQAESDKTDTAIATAVDDIDSSLFNVTQQISGSENSILDSVGGVLSTVNDVYSLLAGGVETTIINEIVLDESIYGNVTDSIQQVLADNNEHNNRTTQRIFDVVESLIAGFLINEADLNADELLILAAIRDAILHNKDVNTAILATTQDESSEGMGATIATSVGAVFIERLKLMADDLKISTRDILLPVNAQDGLDLDCNLGAMNVRPADESAAGWFDFISSIIVGAIWPLTLAQVQAQRCLAVWSEDSPYRVMEPGDIALARNRKLLNDDDALRMIQRNGFTQGDAATMLNAAQEIPAIDILLSAWFRKVIDTDGVNFALEQHGFNDAYIEIIKEIAQFLPPVQDLITMAVREVFSPEIAQANGQFDDFPDDFAELASKQGVSREVALQYWAAHWALPSPQMGYEMLHRRIIDEDTLKQLLRALDVMPAWRDRMIALSYSPLTRVDVRRMHAMGILDRVGVTNAYLDLGYSPDNAELMTQFTEAYNDDGDILDVNVASDLTRSTIIGFYTDGVINRAVAIALLIDAGINAVAAALFIDQADLELERKSRKLDIDLIMDKYRSGAISFEQANDAVTSLNLENRESELARLELLRIREQLFKLPSRTDLDKFLAKQLITKDEYVETLERSGYDFYWAEKYYTLAVGGT